MTKKYNFYELPKNITVEGDFDNTCSLRLSKRAIEALNIGKLKVRIHKLGNKATISSLDVVLECVSGNINIFVGNNNASVLFSEGSWGIYDLRLWRESSIQIGKNTSSNGVTIVCDNSSFICGDDCMFSDTILIQTADQHGIVDLENGEIINDKFNAVRLGDHVWLGRQSTLTSSACVGNGSIIGTGAIVTSSIPDKVIAVGIPAKVIKENFTWCRSPLSLDHFSELYIKEFSSVSPTVI